MIKEIKKSNQISRSDLLHFMTSCEQLYQNSDHIKPDRMLQTCMYPCIMIFVPLLPTLYGNNMFPPITFQALKLYLVPWSFPEAVLDF